MNILEKDDSFVSAKSIKETEIYKETEKKEKVKLTDWKNEPDIAKLKDDLTKASAVHSTKVANINGWLDNLHVRNGAKLKKVKNKSSVQPKVIRKQNEWKYAALSEPFLSTPDLFDLSPVSWEDRKAAQQNSLILNNQFQTKIDKVNFIDNYVRASVDEGTAIVRLGWVFKEGEVEEDKHTFTYTPVPEENIEEFVQYLEQMASMEEEAPDSYETLDIEIKESLHKLEKSGELVTCTLTGTTTVKKTKTILNQPEIVVCDYNDVIFDPSCNGDLDKANFVIYTFESTYGDLKSSGKYENLDVLKDNPVAVYGTSDDFISQANINSLNFSDKSRQKYRLYEYWGNYDIHDNGELVPIVATWCNNTLIRMEENPFPDGKPPFVVVSYLPVKNDLYGEPDGALLEDHHNIIGALTRGMIDLMGKSANGQTGSPKGLLDEVNKQRFLSGQDYEYNGINNLNPQISIFQHKYPEIPQSAMTIIQWLTQDAEALTGTKSFSTGGGISGSGLGDTAAGVRGALDAASKREMGILRRLSNGILKIGRKIISMNAEFLEEEEVVRVTNEKFVKIRKDDLAGNFDLKLTISTAEADNAKAQELAFMLQTTGNRLEQGQFNLIMAEIARLRNMPDLAREIENFKPEPDPVAQKMQELELAKLQAEIDLINAEAAERGSKGQINQAKVPVEQARAAKLASEAEGKQIDNQDNAQGSKHQKQLEVEQQRGLNNLDIAEKSKQWDMRNQLATKAADAFLNPPKESSNNL